MVPQLTSGVIRACMNGEPVPSDPHIQILSFKRVAGQGNLEDRFRIHFSDGEFSHSFGMLSRQLNKHIYEGEIDSFAVVKVKKMVNSTTNNMIIIFLLELEVMAKGSEVGMIIGNPIAWVDGMSRPQVAKLASNYSSSAKDPKPMSNGATPTTSKGNFNGSSSGRRFNSYDYPSFIKKFKMDVPAGAIAPIQDITPHTNGVTIRARVTKKSEVKRWSNGKGKLFSVDLLDESGEIRMIGFNTLVDKFYNMIEVNHVYYVSRFSVKAAKKEFTSIKHEYELSFNNDTQLSHCVKDTSDIPVPLVTYDFVPIADIKHVDADKIIDVIGVCTSVEDCESVFVKKTRKNIQIRDVVLMDKSRKKITLTIWGKTAEEFRDDTQPIIAVKGVKVSDFGGKSLSCLSSSIFQVNPDLPEAHDLRQWYDSEGCKLLRPRSLTKARREGSYSYDDEGSWPARGGPWKFGGAAMMSWENGGWMRY